PLVPPQHLVAQRVVPAPVAVGQAPRKRHQRLLREAGERRAADQRLPRLVPEVAVAVGVRQAHRFLMQRDLGGPLVQEVRQRQQGLDLRPVVAAHACFSWASTPHSISPISPSLSSPISRALSGWCPSSSAWTYSICTERCSSARLFTRASRRTS